MICPLSLTLFACAGGDEDMQSSEAAICTAPPAIDPARSLAVTDQVILDDRFSLERVLGALATSAGSRERPADVYAAWWDTQNPAADARVPDAPHCDDERDATGAPALNGYPLECPRNEGALADLSTHDPFCTGPGCDPYRPIGLFNRFDLAAEDGSDCGEYRIVYGKAGGAFDRNLFIFEAVLPNPDPGCGPAACAPVAEFWTRLSAIRDPARRAAELERFYFVGLPGFGPIVRFENLTHGTGQIRTNQFAAGAATPIWQLREFKLERWTGSDGAPRLRFVPTTVKTNPHGSLFDPTSTRVEALELQSSTGLAAQIPTLVGASPLELALSIDDRMNGGQSTAQPEPRFHDTDYRFWLGAGPSRFRADLGRALARAGSPLTVDQLVDRAQTQTCAGCHQLSSGRDLGAGLVWPASLGFVHVSESLTTACASGTCFQVSPALRDVFLPDRARTLSTYVADVRCGRLSCEAGATTSGLAARTLTGRPRPTH